MREWRSACCGSWLAARLAEGGVDPVTGSKRPVYRVGLVTVSCNLFQFILIYSYV